MTAQGQACPSTVGKQFQQGQCSKTVYLVYKTAQSQARGRLLLSYLLTGNVWRIPPQADVDQWSQQTVKCI
uniref:Ribosomal protein S9 n=1 Tax=Salmo salar TaxID=8030 RepID=M4V3N5_SALSA|nr:ribosomal protein S9 [Salmo salar]